MAISRLILPAIIALSLGLPSLVHATGGGGHSSGSHSSGSHSGNTRQLGSSTHHGGTKAAPGVKRDSHGKIARSAKAKDDFKKTHPCPSTGRSSGACPGYVIDHVVPLKRGGQDQPSNMQWQTTQAAKDKDKWE